MGNSSSYQDEEEDEYDKFDGIETLGYRVLGVQPNSPASVAGLVSFFDFLVGVNGRMLLGSGEGLEEGDEYDDVDLPSLLQERKGQEIELLVYNIKNQETRFATLIPSDSWGGAGLLGVTIRLDNYGGADERLIRVLTVEHNSPAAIAGLVPEQDYLLGTVSESLEDTASLANLLQSHVDRVVEFYVYNTDSDVVRVVALMPTWSWGGRGLLGAEVGTGYLHRLPAKSRNTPGESVERKVRWIRGGSNGTLREEGTEPTSEEPQLEVEPQLEIETAEGEPNSHVTPQEVADMSNPSSSKRSTVITASTSIPLEPAPVTTPSDISEVVTNGATPKGEGPVDPIESNSDAAALFAGPPPSDTQADEVDLR